MARSIATIQSSINTLLVSEMSAIGITIDTSSWSKTNVLRLLTFVFATAAYVLEGLFDTFKSDVNETISQMKPHTLRWYAEKAKLYQHGYSLPIDAVEYDNTGVSDSDITASQIVSYSAVIEQENAYGRISLRVKLATDNGDDLAALTTDQLNGVKEYLSRVKDAGNKLIVESNPADYLRMQWTIYYDPLVLNSSGSRLDGVDSDPVGNAIREYLKELPFNGMFVLQYISDAVESVDGVVIASITGAQVKYGERDYESVNVMYTPDAGYLRIYEETDLSLTFIAQSVIK